MEAIVRDSNIGNIIFGKKIILSCRQGIECDTNNGTHVKMSYIRNNDILMCVQQFCIIHEFSHSGYP